MDPLCEPLRSSATSALKSGSESATPHSALRIPNSLTPTHVFTDDPALRVTAWQYQRTAPIPIWVARKFHRLSDGSALTSLAGDGSLISCLEGDWIVAFQAETSGIGIPPSAIRTPHFAHVAVVLSPSEFTRCFVAL